jgi:hypothetical protein
MRRALILAAILVVEVPSASPYLPHSLKAASTPSDIVEKKKLVTVPAGTPILIRTIDPIDSNKQKSGGWFSGTLETDLLANDIVVAERGTAAYGRLITAKSGKPKGSSQLTLELTDIMVLGTAYPLVTSLVGLKGAGEGENTPRRVIGGTGLGALNGGVAESGKGAVIGAASGSAAGTVVAASKKGQQPMIPIMIPSESLLEFRLQQAASLPMPRWRSFRRNREATRRRS